MSDVCLGLCLSPRATTMTCGIGRDRRVVSASPLHFIDSDWLLRLAPFLVKMRRWTLMTPVARSDSHYVSHVPSLGRATGSRAYVDVPVSVGPPRSGVSCARARRACPHYVSHATGGFSPNRVTLLRSSWMACAATADTDSVRSRPGSHHHDPPVTGSVSQIS